MTNPRPPGASTPQPRYDHAAVERCMLDNRARETIQATADAMLAAIRKTHDVKWTSIRVNERVDNALPLWIVHDADAVVPREAGEFESPVTGECLFELLKAPRPVLDEFTVRGVCTAGTNEIRCSAQALEGLRLAEGELQASPTLLYLLGHELGHLVLGHVGSLAQPDPTVDLSLSEAQKLARLTQACFLDRSQLEREEAADAFALGSLGAAFSEPPFLVQELGPGGSVLQHAWTATDGLRKVLETPGHREAEWFLESPEGTEIQTAAVTSACSVINRREGVETLSFAGGDHPHAATRFANVARESYWLARDRVIRGDRPDVDKALGALAQLRYRYGKRAQLIENGARKFCSEVHDYEAKRLDCKGHASGYNHFRGKPQLNSDAPVVFPELPFEIVSKPRPGTKANLEKALAVHLFIDCADDYRGRERALQAQQDMAKALAVFTNALSGAGLVWLHDKHSNVQAVSGDFPGEFALGGRVEGILLGKGKVDYAQVAGYAELKPLCRKHSMFAPWTQARLAVNARFESTTGKAWIQVSSKPLPMEAVFAIDQALAGKPSLPATTLVQFLRAVQEKLNTRYPGQFRLTALEREGEPVTEPVDLPADWIDLVKKAKQPATTETASLLERVAAAGEGVSGSDVERLLTE
jgi:hypothetical protein